MAYSLCMRLLLVEDELEIQGFLKKSLAEAGYEVDVAGDGRRRRRLRRRKSMTR